MGSLQGGRNPCCPPAPEIRARYVPVPSVLLEQAGVFCVCGKPGWLWVCAVAPGAFEAIFSWWHLWALNGGFWGLFWKCWLFLHYQGSLKALWQALCHGARILNEVHVE